MAGLLGSDTYILDSGGYVQYDDAGNNDYSVIYNFSTQDTIQLGGPKSDYNLKTSTISVGSSAVDTGIYYGNELISVVADITNLNLGANYFDYI